MQPRVPVLEVYLAWPRMYLYQRPRSFAEQEIGLVGTKTLSFYAVLCLRGKRWPLVSVYFKYIFRIGNG
ncbi:hypothetical protein H2248_007014 [Termitomyces sp. 'cryptogamus']|nr:hypothetical protein H2248_007014 [Termitomyces sp. 'cryptogamus']